MSKHYENEAISKFGNNYRINSNNEWLFPCPKCAKFNLENLHVNVEKGVYHCFHCSYSGGLGKAYTLNSVIDASRNKTTPKDFKFPIVYLMPFHRVDLSKPQVEALNKRGITEDDIKYYNITGGKRIQIPNYVIGNLSDMICMWEWRKDKVSKRNPKYLYSEGVKKSNILFNLHNIPDEVENVTLCEGIFNAITAGRTAVASYGCSLSNTQLQLILQKAPKSITIAYDSDLPGVTGSLNVIDMLKNANYDGLVYYILLPKGRDINDLGKENYQSYLKQKRVRINLDSKMSCKLPKLIYDSLD